MGSSSPNRGEHKKYLKPPPSSEISAPKNPPQKPPPDKGLKFGSQMEALVGGISTLQLPSLKLTVRPYKWMVGILLSYWEGLFSGAMLNFGGVVLKRTSTKVSPKCFRKQHGLFLVFEGQFPPPENWPGDNAPKKIGAPWKPGDSELGNHHLEDPCWFSGM